MLGKVAFHTLGCKVNQYETQAISELMENEGYETVDFSQKADVYIINTCTVTSLSASKSRQMIRRARKTNTNAIVAVIGCYPQTSPVEVKEMEEVDLIIGTSQKAEIVKHIKAISQKKEKIFSVDDIMKCRSFDETSLNSFRGRTRAYVKIQDGCSQFCSYCIIPYARGPVRSRKPENIIDEITRLTNCGFKEVVLTGIHIASYGKDLGNIDINRIIRLVHEKTNINRIRISSIEPTTIDDSFIDNFASLPRLCPHLHISLQSGCNNTLKRMNRDYNTDMYEEGVNKLHKKVRDISVTTDVMVGFPGETEGEFLETVEFLKRIPFMQMHVFKYSQRNGTKAAQFTEQVSPIIKEERSRVLIGMSKKKHINYMEKYKGLIKEVLFEQCTEAKPGFIEGHTNNYMKVLCKTSEELEGKITKVLLKEVKDDYLVGSSEE